MTTSIICEHKTVYLISLTYKQDNYKVHNIDENIQYFPGLEYLSVI